MLLQITAPGQAGLNYGAEALATALKGVFLDACAIALDARENTMDAAGSLLEIWRAARHQRERAARRLQLRSAGRAGPHRHALLPRRIAPARSPPSSPTTAAPCRTCTALRGRRPALPRGRRQRGPGAGGHAGDAGGLPARLRGGGAQAARGASPRSRLGLAADADLFLTIAKLRAARKLVGPRRRGLRRRARRRTSCTSPPPPRSA